MRGEGYFARKTRKWCANDRKTLPERSEYAYGLAQPRELPGIAGNCPTAGEFFLITNAKFLHQIREPDHIPYVREDIPAGP